MAVDNVTGTLTLSVTLLANVTGPLKVNAPVPPATCPRVMFPPRLTGKLTVRAVPSSPARVPPLRLTVAEPLPVLVPFCRAPNSRAPPLSVSVPLAVLPLTAESERVTVPAVIVAPLLVRVPLAVMPVALPDRTWAIVIVLAFTEPASRTILPVTLSLTVLAISNEDSRKSTEPALKFAVP